MHKMNLEIFSLRVHFGQKQPTYKISMFRLRLAMLFDQEKLTIA